MSLISACGTTVTARGVSSSGAVNFGEAGCCWYCPSTLTLSSWLGFLASMSAGASAAASAADEASPGAATDTNAVPRAVASRRFGVAWLAVMNALDDMEFLEWMLVGRPSALAKHRAPFWAAALATRMNGRMPAGTGSHSITNANQSQ